MTVAHDLTPTQRAFLLAMWELGGGGREVAIQEAALRIEFKGSTPPSTVHNHYSRAPDQLIDKGLVTSSKVGKARRFWLTERGMRELGEEGPPPTDPELPLF